MAGGRRVFCRKDHAHNYLIVCFKSCDPDPLAISSSATRFTLIATSFLISSKVERESAPAAVLVNIDHCLHNQSTIRNDSPQLKLSETS